MLREIVVVGSWRVWWCRCMEEVALPVEEERF